MAHFASGRRNLSVFLLALCLVMLVAFVALPWLFGFAQGVIRGGMGMPTNPRALQIIQYGGLDFGRVAVLLVVITLGGLLLGAILGVGWAIVLPGAIFAFLTLSSDTYLPSSGFGVVFLGGVVLVMVAGLILRRLKADLNSNQGSAEDVWDES